MKTIEILPKFRVENTLDEMLQRCFIFLSILVFISILFHSFYYGTKTRNIYAIISSALTLIFVYYYLYIWDKKNLVKIFKPILYFNIIIITLYYVSRYNFNLPINEFRVGFTYDNFWDFYFAIKTYVEGNFANSGAGYFPLTYLISKTFSIVSYSQVEPFLISNRLIGWYFVYLLIFLSPTILFIKNIKKTLGFDFEQTFIVVFFILTSYPFLFIIERGNYVLISYFFLSLFVLFFKESKSNAAVIFLTFLINLKVLNFIYIIFLIKYLRNKWKVFVATSVTINILSLIYLFKFDFSKWLLFKISFLAPLQGIFPSLFPESFVVTDGGRLQGMSFVDNIRLLVVTLINNNRMNATTNIPSIELILTLIGIGIAVFYFYRARNQTNWREDLLVLSTLPLAFHSGSADYNLLLVMPIVLLYVEEPLNEFSTKILKYTALFMMLSGGLIIMLMSLGPDSPIYLSISLRSFFIPFSVISLLLLACSKIVESPKN